MIERLVMAAPYLGGYVYATRDGGATWHPLALPPEVGARFEGGVPADPHEEMRLALAVGDSIDRLTLWASSAPRHARRRTTPLRASPDGLLVGEPGKPRRRIYVP